MHSNRRLILIMCLCLVVVGISAAAQFDYYQNRPQDATVATDIPTSTSIDNSFYDTSANASTSTTTRPPIPGLTARAFLIGNIQTGKIYKEYNSTRPLPVASMSKLVTAFVATDIMKGDEVVTVTEEATKAPPDGSNLLAGEKFHLSEILVPLLLNSSNVAAESIASTKDRTRFLELMSSYSWEIGMPKTYFADPSGVNPHNAASGRDLFELAKYLVNYRPDILAVTRIPEADTATTSEHGGHHFSSTHPFVRDPRFIGGKTGRTPDAGETMMTILNINDQPIVFIVLHSEYGYREADTRILLREYETIQ